jgi:multidrug resistance efflux pump
LTRGEKYASKGINGFDKNNSDEIEFYNRLLDNYAKKSEYAVDEQSLKKQGYTDDQIKQAKESQKTKLNELYYDTIMSFTTEKSQLQADKSKLEAQKSALENSISAYKIIAPKTGKIHLNTPITKGMVLQAGNMLGSINNNEEGLIVDVSISSSDRPMIKLGDEVSLAVAGLNQAEYGTVNGKVISIDQDATVNGEKGNIYFNVKVKPEKTFLKDKKGEKVNLTLGMLTETRVKYEKITYMKYFLEQIGIKFN